MKSQHVVRPNPLLSFTVSPSEYKELEKLALERGVTIAQVGRGFFRKGKKTGIPETCFADYMDSMSEVVRLGAPIEGLN